ncbi:DUF2306 domain-containing protein [Jannaschia pohangensis]|uniref:Uncharacterized membrane protein n=1 Tax=Jannaschia pohangensis TaxID=390807 RepID=A0A1I3SLB6_9RHOB|nr:DUF2306 domain-containing protein [Jannaschia pohangensis]SFJ58982.1 Uncharacterized membrane protein [Jannaschia pohangensis]
MTLTPLPDLPIYLDIHILAAMLALVLGPVAIYPKRRDRMHRLVGYVWLSAIVVTAVSSFWLQDFAIIGPLGPIHVFAFLALWGVWDGVRMARARNFAGHSETLRSLYWNGLILAGLFVFLPGRRLNRALFPEAPELGWLIVGLGVSILAWRALRRRADAPMRSERA